MAGQATPRNDWHPSPLTAHGSINPVHEYTYSDTLVAIPYPVFCNMTFDQIGIILTLGAVDGRIRLGIYRDTGYLYPGALVVDAGAVVAEAMGFKTLDIDETFNKELIWLALLCNSDDMTIRATEYYHEILGIRPPNATQGVCFSVIWVEYPYGPLPDPFPTNGEKDFWFYLECLRVKEFNWE